MNMRMVPNTNLIDCLAHAPEPKCMAQVQCHVRRIVTAYGATSAKWANILNIIEWNDKTEIDLFYEQTDIRNTQNFGKRRRKGNTLPHSQMSQS